MVKQLWKVMKASWKYCLIAFLVFYMTFEWKLGGTPFHNNNSITMDRYFVSYIDLREVTANFTAETRPVIPHIIHQIWDTDRVPKDFSEWISSWTKFHPRWEYWFWTHKDFRTFLKIVDPAFVKDYDSYTAGQLKADVMRFYIMYYFGGVYADLDVHVLKPLDKWTYSRQCVLPEETHAHPFIMNNYTHSPAMITLLLCRPGHPYFKLAIQHIHEYTTGTYTKKLLFVDDVYQEYLKDNVTLKHPENQIYLAPPEYFLPTYDPMVFSEMKERCSTDYIIEKMTKQQKDTCAKLDQVNWDNNPSEKSYTDHHWVHVIMNENGWKEKQYIWIQDIVPHRKNIATVIAKFKLKLKAKKSNTKPPPLIQIRRNSTRANQS